MSKEPKPAKFNFEELKAGATSQDPRIRKNIFIEYFERFQEFPSYLFDNDNGVDARLSKTIQDIVDDPETPSAMQKGITVLLERLPATHIPSTTA